MSYQLVRTGIEDLVPMKRTGNPEDHVSAIIRYMCLELGHFSGDSDIEEHEVVGRQTRWELGSAFEEAVRSGLAERYRKSDPHRYIVPGELESDGIIGSPDLLDMTEPSIVEVKLTWLSARHDPEGEKFWKYWVQLKAYCFMAGIQAGELHVCHIQGDYRERRYPIYNVWRPIGGKFRWSDLEENWQMLLSHREEMKRRSREDRGL